MKFKLSAQILAAAFLMGASAAVHATAYSWTASGAGNWSTTTSWTPTGAPINDGDAANFSNGGGQRRITVGLSPNLSSLTIGSNSQGNVLFEPSGGNQTITIRGDVSNPNPGLYVAYGTTAATSGSLVLSSGMTISLVGGEFFVGVGTSNSGRANGAVILENGSALNIGTSTQRSEWQIGVNAVRVDTRNSSVTGTTGAAVSAYVKNLTIGANNAAAPSTGAAYNGTLDLTKTTVSAFDVSGNIVIGRGVNHAQGSYGTLSLGKIDTTVGGNITVGDTVAESSGVVNLLGTHMEVGGNVLLDTTGRIRVTLDGESAGLSLSTLSTLTINALGTSAGDLNAGYHITFSELSSPLSLSDIYYGFAWEGDHLTTLNTLVGNNAITWTNLMSDYNPTVFYDLGTNTTYIGVVPEPGSVALAIGGLLFAGIALKQRKDRVSNA